jgi:hypothetical protein
LSNSGSSHREQEGSYFLGKGWIFKKDLKKKGGCDAWHNIYLQEISMNEVEEQGRMDNYLETSNDDFCVTLESIIDIIPPKMGPDSTSPSSNVNIPTCIFDNKFIFSIFDKMMHYKLVAMEDYSSIYIWKEKCELKHTDNIEFLKNIASMESVIVKQIEESSNTINKKDDVIVGLCSEVSEITKECNREVDNTKAMFEMTLSTYENTISNIQE